MVKTMKSMKKLLSIALILVCILNVAAFPAFADNSASDPSAANASSETAGSCRLIRFLPTTVTITLRQAVVEGYLVNLNENVTVQNLKNADVTFYMNGSELFTANIGDVDITVAPLSAAYLCITFDGFYGLKSGTYECDDTMYGTLNADFTSIPSQSAGTSSAS